jgi:serine/threonine-protein kinase
VRALCRDAGPGPGVLKGNVDFMSPEQARGAAADRRTDLFALGLVMYYCAARAPLYRGRTLYDQLLAAAKGPGERERAFIAGLPPPLPEILPRMVAVDPAHRHDSAGELRAAIAAHTHDGRAQLASCLTRLFGTEIAEEQARLQAG